MFGMFKKKPSASTDQHRVAGIWTGVLYRQNCSKFGQTPAEFVHRELEDILKNVLVQMRLNLNDDEKAGVLAIASTVGNDESGFGERLEKRFDAGDKTLTRQDVEYASSLTLKMVKQFASGLVRK
jgi:hypothetical protein